MDEACAIIREAAECDDVQINFGVILNESLADAVKITVIATGFRPDMPGRRADRVSHAAAAISQSRTAGSYEVSSPEPEAHASAPSAEKIARPEVRNPGPERETSLDAARGKNNYEQDDLDVPAFIRKRRDVQ